MGAHKQSVVSLLFFSMLACGGAEKPKLMTGEEVSMSGEPASTSENVTTTSGDATKKYAIHLHRADHVGARVRVVIDTTEDAEITLHLVSNGKAAHEHRVKHFHLEGESTTTALDDHQDELRLSIDVAKLSEDGIVLLKGKRLDITKGVTKDDATVNVDGKPVSMKIRKALEDIMVLRIDSASSNDIAFGSKQPQSVGSQWSINGDRAQADLANNTGVESGAVSGQATLVGVERIAGADVLRIKVDLDIDGMIYPLKQPGATCDPTQGKMVATVLYPVDESHSVLELHTSFAAKPRIHARGRSGKVTGDVDLVAQQDLYVTPL